MKVTSLLTLALALVLCYTAQAQNAYDQEWHFGDGISLDFSTGSPVLGTSSVNTNTNVEPASVCNNIGVLMAYTDGDTLFNALGQAVVNGGFGITADENIFSAIPGSPNKFYLFRSSDSFGITWSIVDLEAAGGQGEILDIEKNQELYPHASQMNVTSHADMENFWLVVANNSSAEGSVIKLTSFAISATGIEEIFTFSGEYTWAGSFGLDEARISPTCEQVAVSFKGHRIIMFEFDNSTGELTTEMDNPAITVDSFGTDNFIEYSPTGDYLYVLGDLTSVVRYDASILDPTDFIASLQDLGFGQVTYTHIKLGPNGLIYLMNQNSQVIDVIEDADEETPILIQDAIELETNARFFPNTMNSCQVFSDILVTDACVGDSTYFISNIGTEADSIYWVIDGEFVQDTVYDLLTFNELYPDVGDYNVSFNFLFDTLWTTIEDISTVYAQPIVNLGLDSVTCAGEEVVLSTGIQPYSINWNTGESTEEITVTETGIYSVQIINGLCNAYDEVYIEFIPEPASGLEDIVICDTIYPITLDATGTYIDDYQWIGGPSGPELTVEDSGTYTITLTNECFETTESADVTYIIFPDDLLDDEYVTCAFDTLFLSSIYTEGQIGWSNGDVGVDAEILSEGTYTLTINHLGCIISDEFFADFIQVPVSSLEDVVICDTIYPITLDATGEHVDLYQWLDGPTAPMQIVDTTGVYPIKLSNDCFVVEDSASVTFVLFPDDLLDDEYRICGTDTLLLSSIYPYGDITWSNGDEGIFTQIITQGFFTLEIDHLGCFISDEFYVDRLDYIDANFLEMPNVVTYNGDSLNNNFRPFIPWEPQTDVCQYQTLTVDQKIYNRWGNLLEEGDCGWDGDVGAGVLVSEGTYYYIVDMVSKCLEHESEKRISNHFQVFK